MLKPILLIFVCFVLLSDATKLKVKLKILERNDASKISNYDLVPKIKSDLEANTLNLPWKVLDYTLSFNGTQANANEASGNTAVSLRTSNSIFALLIACFLFTTGFQRTAFLAVFCGLLFQSGVFAITREYDHCKLMDNGVQYKLYWKINGPSIAIGIETKSAGWAAVGLSRNGQMNSGGTLPSDIMLGYRGANFPAGIVNDYSTKVYDKPILDATQNVEFISSASQGGILTLEFNRKLNTNDDPYDIVITPGQQQYVLYAQSDSMPNNQTSFVKHSTKGSTMIDFGAPSECPNGQNEIVIELELNTTLANFDSTTLINSLSSKYQLDDYRFVVLSTIEESDPFCPDCTVAEFRYPNYSIPAEDTTYACAGFVFPFDVDRHIIKFEAILDNALVVHHLLLYQVPNGLPPYNNGDPSPILCNMAPKTSLPMFAWAPGGNPVVPPDNVGFRVGGSSGIKYAVLQIHYNNPTSIAGLYDSSGVRMYLTNKTRQYDGGLIFLGISPSKTGVPGRQAHWHQSGSCLAMFTQTLGVTLNVFGNMNHMHTLGRTQWTEQYRDGKYIGNVGEVHGWDFASQKFVPINHTIQPGDELITRCIYDTSNKQDYTAGGESSQQEMCVNALIYYPITPNLVCWQSNTAGCSCDYGEECLHSKECITPIEGYCGGYKDCNSCKTNANCTWCDSGSVSTCLNNQIYNATNICSNKFKGVANQCSSSTPAATCSTTHSTCESCKGDTANGCTWCFFTEFSSLSDVCTNSTDTCRILGGWPKTQC